jgi:multidrug efflux system membrane fusion protein
MNAPAHPRRLARPLAAAATTALLLASIAACTREAPAGERPPVPVRVRPVEPAATASGARYSATIAPRTRIDVAFRVSGYIQDIARQKGLDGQPRILQEGDQVTRGSELARLRESDYLQRVAEARASIAEATSSLEQSKLEFERTSRLVQSQSLPQAELDAARNRLGVGSARLDAARARLKDASTAAHDSVLRAPIDGTVIKRTIEVGSYVAPGTQAFTLADTTHVKAIFGVPDSLLETLRPGTEVSFTTEALKQGEFSGQVTRISPVADPKSRAFEVEVSIPNPRGDLKAGMVVSLKLQVAPAAASAAAVSLPLTAVVRPPGKDRGFGVFVIDAPAAGPGAAADSGVAVLREVELGEFLGNTIGVRSGLKAGERVVVQGATLLSSGERVRIIP